MISVLAAVANLVILLGGFKWHRGRPSLPGFSSLQTDHLRGERLKDGTDVEVAFGTTLEERELVLVG